MKARLIRHLKKVYPNGVLVEMVLWQLPGPTGERPHGLKYRFYCGRDGLRIVRYDNENGKGDHIHYGNEEHPYVFVSPERLVADFLGDVAKLAEIDDEET
jgi:hypothetical protein